MAGGRGIDEDQIGEACLLDLFDFAEHQNVPDAGNGARDDVDDSRRHQALREPAEPVVGQVFDEGIVRGDPPGLHTARRDVWRLALGPEVLFDLVGARRAEHGPGVIDGVAVAEGVGDTRSTFELDDQDRQSGVGCHPGDGRHHGRLPDAALTRHDQDVTLHAESADVHDAPERSVLRPPIGGFGPNGGGWRAPGRHW